MLSFVHGKSSSVLSNVKAYVYIKKAWAWNIQNRRNNKHSLWKWYKRELRCEVHALFLSLRYAQWKHIYSCDNGEYWRHIYISLEKKEIWTSWNRVVEKKNRFNDWFWLCLIFIIPFVRFICMFRFACGTETFYIHQSYPLLSLWLS